MRCKKGELAFIIGGCTENISKVVQIIGEDSAYDEHYWVVESPNKNLTGYGLAKRERRTVDVGLICDGYLSPIRGLSKKEIDEILAKDKERHV